MSIKTAFETEKEKLGQKAAAGAKEKQESEARAARLLASLQKEAAFLSTNGIEMRQEDGAVFLVHPQFGITCHCSSKKIKIYLNPKDVNSRMAAPAPVDVNSVPEAEELIGTWLARTLKEV